MLFGGVGAFQILPSWHHRLAGRLNTSGKTNPPEPLREPSTSTIWQTIHILYRLSGLTFAS